MLEEFVEYFTESCIPDFISAISVLGSEQEGKTTKEIKMEPSADTTVLAAPETPQNGAHSMVLYVMSL